VKVSALPLAGRASEGNAKQFDVISLAGSMAQKGLVGNNNDATLGHILCTQGRK
jgi:hypothetical protein